MLSPLQAWSDSLIWNGSAVPFRQDDRGRILFPYPLISERSVLLTLPVGGYPSVLDVLHDKGKQQSFYLGNTPYDRSVSILLQGPLQLEGFLVPPETSLLGWELELLPEIILESTRAGIQVNISELLPGLAVGGSISVLGNRSAPLELLFLGRDSEKRILWKDPSSPLSWDSRWLGFIPREIKVIDEDVQLISRETRFFDTLTPAAADFNAVLFSAALSESFNLYRWSADPSILVFDFQDYNEQARWLKRLAFFIEKPGFRGQILSNEELEGKHGWNAHDYSAGGLADFFNAAGNFPLNPEELELKDILLNQGIIRYDGITYSPNRGAVISISRESSEYLRQQFITHEAIHGLFFTDKEYRESVFRYWEQLDEEFQRVWETYLYYYEHPYDSSWTYLAVNELAAYFLQSPASEAESYFTYRFNRVAEQQPEARDILRDFLNLSPERFQQTAEDMEQLLREHFPFRAGDFTNMEILD